METIRRITKYNYVQACILLFFILALVLSPSFHISDSSVPFSAQYISASFYLVDADDSSNLTKLGMGKISSDFSKNSSISNSIIEQPDYSSFISSGETIEWEKITTAYGKCQVFGKIITDSSFALATPSQSSAQKGNSSSYNSIEELIRADLTENQYIHTNGYYFPNDGGAADYYICKYYLDTNNSTAIKLDNGLVALLQKNPQMSVHQFGAKGDSMTDDSSAIQSAIDFCSDIYFSPNHTYLLQSNGIYLRNNVSINGNNSSIMVNDSYSPINADFEKRIIRTDFSRQSSLTLTDLNIDVNFKASRYSDIQYMCVLQPTYIDNVTLSSVNINIANSDNEITALWLDHGCSSLLLDKCNFYNYTTNLSGGVLFLDSEPDPFFDYYNAFKNVCIQDCNFVGTCGDEIVAFWGPNNINASITNTTFQYNRACTQATSRLINIACSSNTKTDYNISFSTCTFNIGNLSNSLYCDSLIGVGTLFPSATIQVSFDSCTVNANIRDSLLHFQLLPSKPDNISLFDSQKPNTNIIFKNSNIVCNKSICGSNSFYDNTSGSTWANNCTFTNCNINCKYCFAFLECYGNTPYYYVPSISISNSEIQINSAIGFIYKTSKSAIANLTIEQNIITGNNTKDIITYRYTSENYAPIISKNYSKTSSAIANNDVSQ